MLYLASYWSKTNAGAPPPGPLSKFWYGPLWPLPPLTVLVPGTGVSIISTLVPGDLESSEYYEAVAVAFIVSAPSTNHDTIYLVQRFNGVYSKNTSGTVVLAIEPGKTKQFPVAKYAGNRYQFGMFGIDGEEASDVANVCAIMQ